MRTAAITALGLFLAAGSAWAQSSYDYRDRDDSRSGSYGSQSYSSDRSSRSSANDDDDDRRGAWSSNDRGKWNHGRHGGKNHARGASFYMKHGDKEFRIRCGTDDSTRECIDAAMSMFRQVQQTASGMSSSPMHSMGGSGNGSSSGSTSSGSVTTTSPSTSGSSATGSSTSTPGASGSSSTR